MFHRTAETECMLYEPLCALIRLFKVLTTARVLFVNAEANRQAPKIAAARVAHRRRRRRCSHHPKISHASASARFCRSFLSSSASGTDAHTFRQTHIAFTERALNINKSTNIHQHQQHTLHQPDTSLLVYKCCSHHPQSCLTTLRFDCCVLSHNSYHKTYTDSHTFPQNSLQPSAMGCANRAFHFISSSHNFAGVARAHL